MRRTRVERGIYRQQNGTYGVYLLVDGKPRYKTVGPKLGQARRHRDLLSARAQAGELRLPPRITFGQLADSWLDGFAALVASGERAERTLEHYRYQLDRNLLPTFAHRPLHEITTDDIANLIASLRARGLSAKTINGALVPVGRIFAIALRRGYVNANPLNRLDASERPRPNRREPRVLTHQQITQLLNACLPTHRPLIATATYTGMRLSELLGLTWQDITFNTGLIHVRHQLSRATRDRPARRVRLKTRNASRDIPLLPQLANLLKEHKLASRHAGDNDYVFATSNGTPHSSRNVERRGLRRAAELAGLEQQPDQPRLRVHDLRHTFASHLIIELKLDVPHVSRILGHARPSITLDTYTHLFNQAAHADNIRQQMAESEFATALTATPSTEAG